MRRFLIASLAAVLGVAGLMPTHQAAAYEQEYFEMQRRIAQLEGLVADMQERQPAQTTFASETKYLDGEPANTGCTSCGGGGCTQCCPSACVSCRPTPSPLCGPYASFDVATMVPFGTNGDSPTIGTAGASFANFGAAAAGAAFTASGAANTPTGLGFFVVPRVTLGYTAPSGWGVRTRWFYYDHTNTPVTDGAQNITARLHAMTWDVETYGTLRRGRQSGTMFGGYRYADLLTVSQAFNGAVSFNGRQGAYGNGITGGITGTSVVGRTGNMSIFSGIRGSMLMGDLYAQVFNSATGATPYQKTQTYNVFSIWEVNIGSTYRRPLRNGTTLLIGSSVECQFWMDGGSLNPWTYVAANPVTAATGGPFNGPPGSFMLLGFWNNIGVQF